MGLRYCRLVLWLLMASARRAVLGNVHFTSTNVKGICSDASYLNCAASLRPGEVEANECKMVGKTVGTIFGRLRQRWADNSVLNSPHKYLLVLPVFCFIALKWSIHKSAQTHGQIAPEVTEDTCQTKQGPCPKRIVRECSNYPRTWFNLSSEWSVPVHMALCFWVP